MKLLYQDSCGINQKNIITIGTQLLPYIERLQKIITNDDYSKPESALNLASNSIILDVILKIKKEKINRNLKYIFVIGIGGSNLGTKAVYDATYGYYDVLAPQRYPKIIFLDTNNGGLLLQLKKFLKTSIKKPEEILINVISKSGATTETAANFEIIFGCLKNIFNARNILDRTIIITDENSLLWQMARKKNLTVLPIPKTVGGRFSVLSAVGLFPLSAAGIDVEKLLQGAHQMRTQCMQRNITKNPAIVSAVILYEQYGRKRNINDNFFFHPELESLGKWYRQLMGESIGKEKKHNGKRTPIGITPTVSIGSTDLHSVGQLYLGGPDDKITTFINTEVNIAANITADITLPEKLFFSGLVENLGNKTTTQIMRAIYEGVITAYNKRKIPFMEVILRDISPYSLGQFLQFKMMEMMYLGHLLQINTFDQPNVEMYKKETRKILKNI